MSTTKKWPPKIRYDSRFEKGTNVNFLNKNQDHSYSIRTYERGVENETLACGTGVTAAGIILLESLEQDVKSIKINARGGTFEISRDGQDYYLIGPTEFIFSGEI